MPPGRYPPGVNPYAPSSSASGPTSGARGLPPRPGLPTGSRYVSSSGSLRGSGFAGSSAGPGKMLLEDVDIDDFPPPKWRTVLNRRADLGKSTFAMTASITNNVTRYLMWTTSADARFASTGYPDYYPSRPGFDQPEDVLTEDNVKNGFNARAFVAAEAFSMHGPIYQHLLGGGIGMLAQLGQEIMEKRLEAMPQIGERTFKIPVRVTYNDTKRLQFLSDLANPKVPLYRLMHTPVPHGFKGVELLDAMFSPASGGGGAHSRATSGSGAGTPKLAADPIPLDRALWFIRVLGANEISAHRSRTQPTTAAVNVNVSTPVGAQVASPAAAATPSSTTTVAAAPTLPVSSDDWYTQEFTNTYISWLRVQLGHLALPGNKPAKPGLPALKTGLTVLSDENARAKWLVKWDYSTRLLRELHARRLISTRLLSGWLADYLGHTNLAQLGFVAQLIGAYLRDISKHISNARHCLRAACEKLKEIKASPAADTLVKIEKMLISIITSLYKSDSDVLFSPSLWRAHSVFLADILPSDTPVWQAIRQRNDAMSFKPAASESSSSPRRQQMEEIQKLDSICDDTNMLECCRSFFDGTSSPTSTSLDTAKLQEKINILLNWAMGLFQLGCHRPYAVYTMLKHWSEQYEEHQAKQSRPQTIDLFEYLYKWLDQSDAARKEDNAQAIGIAFGELTRQGMWSYGRYLQSLIAKGQTARSRTSDQPKSHHLSLLRVMPIFVEAKDLLQQRRIALSGDDSELRQRDEAEEQRILETFQEEVQEYIPEIFGYKRYGRSASLKDQIDYQLPSIGMMNRFLYVHARFWLARMASVRLKRQGRTPPMDASTFARVIQVFRISRGFATIADFIDRALQDSEDEEILEIILDLVKRDADVWTAMDRWPRLGDKLLHRYEVLEKEGRHRHHPRLLKVLLDLAIKDRMTKDDGDLVEDLFAEQVMARDREPKGKRLDLKDSIPQLEQIFTAGKTDDAISLAPRLFSRHGEISTWGLAWWLHLVDILQRSSCDRLDNSPVAMAIVAHINAVDQEKSDGVTFTIASWLHSLTPQASIDFFGRRSAFPVVLIMLEVAAQRHLSTVMLLEKAIYPIWKFTSSICLTPRRRLNAKQTQAAITALDMACQLLVYPPLDATLPPNNLVQSLVLLSSRQEAFKARDVPNLIRHLPLLVVLERSGALPEKSIMQISLMLKSLAMTAEFKTAAFRNLNLLKDAFLSTEWSKSGLVGERDLEAGMVETLKMIMAEKPSSLPKPQNGLPTFEKSARLSAWRWTRIVLEMRVEFKSLATRISSATTASEVNEARQTLNRLVCATLDREMTVDDTDLLCEAFRGMNVVVTQEILAAGLDKLSSLLGLAIGAETQHQLETHSRLMDQILRIVDSTTNNNSDNDKHRQTGPISDSSVLLARQKLLELLSVALQSIERHLSTPAASPGAELVLDISPPRPSYLLKVVLNLLRFALGLGVVETTIPTMPKPNFPQLAVCFFRVMIAYQQTLDAHTAVMLSDMLAHIVDSTPPQSRLALQNALLGETTSASVQSSLSALPQLASALPHLSPPCRNMSLHTSTTGDEGSVDTGIPMDDRRWELFEQMVPETKGRKHQDLFLSSTPFRDTASIPISLFGPKIARDAIPARSSGDGQSDGESEEEGDCPWERYASERDLGDGQAGQPAYIRQKVTGLFAPGPAGPESDDGQIDQHSITGTDRDRERDGTEPVYAHPRRMSTRLAISGSAAVAATAKSLGLGFGLGSSASASGSGSHQNPIALDSDEDDDDDDLPLATAAKRPRTASTAAKSFANNNAGASGSGSTATAAAGTGTGRQTTGGKAPRKTTAGKAPARKTVGGKSARGPGTAGKAPRGRRKSQAE